MVGFCRKTPITAGMLLFSVLALVHVPARAGDALAHLADVRGRAVYMLSGAPCEGYCALLWLPVPAGEIAAPSPADARLVGARTLSAGRSAATYAGKPVYYFAEDVLPGDMNGHRFEEFRTIGYLVGSSGREIGGRAASISYADDEACGCSNVPVMDVPVTIAARFATAFAGPVAPTHFAPVRKRAAAEVAGG